MHTQVLNCIVPFKSVRAIKYSVEVKFVRSLVCNAHPYCQRLYHGTMSVMSTTTLTLCPHIVNNHTETVSACSQLQRQHRVCVIQLLLYSVLTRTRSSWPDLKVHFFILSPFVSYCIFRNFKKCTVTIKSEPTCRETVASCYCFIAKLREKLEYSN